VRAVSAGPRVLRAEGAPPLGELPREGPVAVVAVLAMPPDHAPLVAAWLERRLAAEGATDISVEARPEGVRLVATLAPKGDTAATVRRIAKVVLTKVDPARDAEALVAARTALVARAEEPELPAEHVRCRGDAPAVRARDLPPEGPRLAALVEEARARGVAEGHVTFGTSGPHGTAATVAAALRAAAPWPGPPAPTTAPTPTTAPAPTTAPTPTTAPAPTTAPTPPATPEPAPEPVRSAPGPARALHVSLFVPLGARAAHAARALAAPTGPLARLAARDGATVTSVTASATIDASCIDVALALTETQGPRVLPLAGAVEAALARGLDRADPAWPAAATPAESAAFAALFAASAAPPRAGTRAARTLVAGTPARPVPLPAPAVPARPALPVAARAEPGASDAAVALLAPCASLDETASDAGLAAAALAAAASDTKVEGVSLAPIVTPGGLGVLARGPKAAGETDEAHLERVAGAAAAALAGPAGERARSAALARAVAHASSDPQRLLAVLAETLAPGRPALLVPTGTTSSLALASDDAVRARAVALAEGPLAAEVVSVLPAAAAERVVRDVAARYALGADGACREFTPRAPPSVRVGVRALAPRSDDHVAIVFVDEARRRPETMHAVADAVRDGALAAELADKARDVRAEVAPFGATSALVVHFVSPRDRTNDAITAARALLARAAVRVPDAAFRRAASQAAKRGVLVGSAGNAGNAVTADDTKSAASALFVSGGVVGVLGR